MKFICLPKYFPEASLVLRRKQKRFSQSTMRHSKAWPAGKSKTSLAETKV